MYQVSVERGARKDLARLPEKDYQRALAAIHELGNNPRPAGCKKLVGRDGWRIRIGNYRVLYDINDQDLTVLVVYVARRRDV